jgi:hypothetical protein
MTTVSGIDAARRSDNHEAHEAHEDGDVTISEARRAAAPRRPRGRTDVREKKTACNLRRFVFAYACPPEARQRRASGPMPGSAGTLFFVNFVCFVVDPRPA